MGMITDAIAERHDEEIDALQYVLKQVHASDVVKDKQIADLEGQIIDLKWQIKHAAEARKDE